MVFENRWKNPQGATPQQLYLWAQDLIKELRKGAYLDFVADEIDDDIAAAVQYATDAEVRAASPTNRILTAQLLETASALVTLPDAASVAVDWDAFINGFLVIAGNRTLANPTNGQPGTWRTIYAGGSGGPWTLSFGNQYRGADLNTLTDISGGKAYLLSIWCRTPTFFVVGFMPTI